VTVAIQKIKYWNDYLKGRVPDALPWSHTHSHDPKHSSYLRHKQPAEAVASRM
jgi:hypothetical protein